MVEVTYPIVQSNALMMRPTAIDESIGLESTNSTMHIGSSNYILASSSGLFKY